MKTPKHWDSNNLLSWLLLPLSYFYYLGFSVRKYQAKPAKLPIPVICIGNLTAGGAGKTPVALALGQMLKEKGINAYFISRGYGGAQQKPILVNPEKHSAKKVGDEPLLLASVLPTIVGKNRVQTAKYAANRGAELIIMDDGFQNPTIHKDLSLVVVSSSLSFGNNKMLPAGPLREPLSAGLKRADGLIVVNPATYLKAELPDTPLFIARTIPQDSMKSLSGKKILAFCGIAHPNKFYKMLAENGAEIIAEKSFADHHNYRKSDLTRLQKYAEKNGLILVTTSKDFARIPKDFRDFVHVAKIELVFENQENLEKLIESILEDPT